MAHSVVIAGGGFAGANAARELERLLPRQSTRLVLVNDVNFLLYTPLLPEAAAGMLEPRHVVTPLRDILRRTYLRMGAVSAHDPVARTVELTTHEGEVEELPYDRLLVAFGSVSRSLPVPGLDRHAIGFKSLADAIWIRNHIVETLEEANATEDPARREGLLSYVFAAGDCAAVPSPDGGLCPPTAQHAIRQARVAAHNIAADLGVGRREPFAYRNRGSFVNLGRYKAVASIPGGVTLSGFPAWWAARTYHVSQIPGFARKLRAVADWTVGLPFRRDTAEVGSIGHPRPLRDEAYERGGSHRPLE